MGSTISPLCHPFIVDGFKGFENTGFFSFKQNRDVGYCCYGHVVALYQQSIIIPTGRYPLTVQEVTVEFLWNNLHTVIGINVMFKVSCNFLLFVVVGIKQHCPKRVCVCVF